MYPFRCLLCGCPMGLFVVMIIARLIPYPRRLAIIVLGVAVFGLGLNAKLSLYHREAPASTCSNVTLSIEDRFTPAVPQTLQRLADSLPHIANGVSPVPAPLLIKASCSHRHCKRGLLRASFAQNHCPSLHLRPPPISIPALAFMPEFKA
jgi:hypothetical protein